MDRYQQWQSLGWRHQIWELVRYFCSIKRRGESKEWLESLEKDSQLIIEEIKLNLPCETVRLFQEYLTSRTLMSADLEKLLRTEDRAVEFCKDSNFKIGTTITRNKDHHQSSKALVSMVSGIAQAWCNRKGMSVNVNPQNRCVWLCNDELHVTSRNLDGAIPGLGNPMVIWEIKEYWSGFSW